VRYEALSVQIKCHRFTESFRSQLPQVDDAASLNHGGYVANWIDIIQEVRIDERNVGDTSQFQMLALKRRK
jgi:hypothetical protein